MKLSLTVKVFIAIVGMILIILGGVVFFFELKTRGIAAEEVSRRLRQTDQAFKGFESATRDKLAAVNEYISGNAYFKAYMADAIDTGDTGSMIDQFDEIRNFSYCDFMIVLDVDGELIVDTSDRIAKDAENRFAAFLEEIDRRLESEDAPEEGYAVTGILPAQGKLYYVVMSPLISSEFLHGFVMVGYVIDDAQAEEIGRIANCDVMILSGDSPNTAKLVSSYFEESENRQEGAPVLTASLPGEASGKIFDFKFQNLAYKGLINPLSSVGEEMVGYYVIVKPLERELRPFRDISAGLLLIGGFAFVIMAPLSIVAARGVTRPVNHLVTAIEKVRDGEYDEKAIAVESGDEIGVMAAAFKSMVKELREQQEMIEFLQESASERGDTTVIDPDQTMALPASPTQTPSIAGEMLRRVMSSQGQLPDGFVLADRYEITGVLGRGGMGVVYKAKDRTLEEVVAIKMLHVNNPELADMLKRETKLARKITHRNILRIYDLGELDDYQFISMEFVNGATLKSLLRRVKRLPLTVGVRIVRQMCLGLRAAQDAGIVHGDIKPENIMINTGKGEVKVMDFGVARAVSLDAAAGEQTVSGTPAYMSPEQFQGGGVDNRSDIYSLGVMMFEMFTGKTPFTGNSVVELFKQHLTKPLPSLCELNPEAPEELERIVATAAAKKPDHRYHTVEELLIALKALT